MWASKRFSCCFSSDSNYQFIKNSNKNSYLYRIIDQKNRPDGQPCYLDGYFMGLRQLAQLDVARVFLLATRMNIYLSLNFFSDQAKNKIVFESSLADYEIIYVNYIAAGLEKGLKSSMQVK